MPTNPIPTELRRAPGLPIVLAVLVVIVVVVALTWGSPGSDDDGHGAGTGAGDHGGGTAHDDLGVGGVYLVGDSLTARAGDHVDEAFHDAGFDVVATEAMGGTHIEWASRRVRAHVGDHRDHIVVIASGTNNTPDGWTDEDREATLAALEEASSARCSVWVLPATVRWPVVDGERRRVVSEQAEEVHDRIAALAEEHGTHVADWAAEAADEPEWYIHDGIHHTPEGDAAFAEFLATRTREHCGTP